MKMDNSKAAIPATSDVASAGAGFVTLTQRVKREIISVNDSDNDNNGDNDNAPSSSYYEEKDYYSGKMKTGSQQQQKQQQQQHEQEQEQQQHPYASLYEPLLIATKTAEFGACPSSSPKQQQQQPEEISSSSFAAAVAEQSPFSTLPLLNAATSSYRTREKKRQKNDCSDQNNNNIAENTVQSVRVVHEDNNAMMDLNDQVTHIVNTFLDDDIDIGASFDSSDDEADIERCAKLATKKKKKTNTRSAGTATASSTSTAAAATKISYKSNGNRTDNLSNDATMKNIIIGDRDARWKEMYKRLVAYKKEHNNTNVPQRCNKDPQLGRWVNAQRISHRKKKMTESHKCLLNSIEFVWEFFLTKNKATWEEMYQRLVAHKNEHKTKIPQIYKEDLQLGRWVNTQRSVYKNKKMMEERKRLLNSISFVWEDSRTGKNNNGEDDAQWEEMYQRLVAYKQEHKNIEVLQRCKEDPRLGHWVNYQRTVYRDDRMTEKRKRLLNSIDFVWEVSPNKKEPWEEMYKRLVAYKKEHNGTNVPHRYEEDPHLGYWVQYQRSMYRNDKITEMRKRLLNTIGFVWNMCCS